MTRSPERSDSAQLLERLERENLFLATLDNGDARAWYRYHPLFAEALRQHARQQLGDAQVRALHERASAWYEAQGMHYDAVEAAIVAGQVSRAAALIEGLFDRGGLNELYTLARWVERLPSATLPDHPLLCLATPTPCCSPPTATPRPRRMSSSSGRAWPRPPGSGRKMSPGWGRSPRCVRWWRSGRTICPRHLPMRARRSSCWTSTICRYRSVSLLYGAQEQLFAGRADAAQRLLMESYTLFEITQNIHGRQAATMGLGDLCWYQADLESAAHYFRQVLDGAVGGEEMLDDQSYALCGLGAIAYERDDLELAEQQAQQAHELARRRHSEMLLVRSALILSLVRQARGQKDQARLDLQALAAQTRNAQLLRELHSGQARLALATGDLEAAQRWRAAVLAQGAPVSQLQAEHEGLTLARLQLAQGDPQAARATLERWRADAAAQGRTRSEVEILALQALAHSAQADRAAAAQALTQALSLGQPRGLRRIFLDLGEPLAALVREAAPSLGKRTLAAYAATLLRTLTPGHARTPPTIALPLLEPLSPQEQRVLRMIVAGRTNPEIARELVVSANTVKTHIKNIYRKLNVGTREEAQAAARELHLR